MTDIRILMTWPMPIGKYKATFLPQVPIDYLKSLVKDKKAIAEYPQIAEYLDYLQRTELAESIQAKIDTEYNKQVCSKITYATESIAKAALRNIKMREQKHKKPYRAYECPDCGGWHLTSKEHINWIDK